MLNVISGIHGAPIPPKPTVSGGTLTSDATYYYRTFTSTNTLTVSTADLTADVLCIAGGAGGAKGGGGAGGYIYSSSQTLTPNSYTATVGAGGAAGTYDSANGVNGNISNLTGGSLSLTQLSLIHI